MEFKYQLRMWFARGGLDFAELPCGKWEWDSLDELIGDLDYLFRYVREKGAESCYITKAWGDGEEVDMDYEIIWGGKYDESESDSDDE